MVRRLALRCALALAPLSLAPAAAAQAALTGVNLAGAEFGEGALPGTYGVNYTYPTTAEVDHFVGRGMNVFRVPFRWERLQRSLNGPLDATELGRLDGFVAYATGRGATVVLDPHNYARYNGAVVGSGALPNSAYADFWARVADHYRANPRVAFGLMNEPNTMPTEQWLAAANAAIAAIRGMGATNLVLVPGNAWTGAFTWFDTWYGTPNASVMGGVVDPGSNYAYELHQYLDSDGSGQQSTCVSATVGSQRLQAVTAWLRQRGARGFLGEFGAAANPTCLAALDDVLDYVDANTDVWLGWTYWAAGPWWGDYFMSLEPQNGVDRPQMAPLLPHLAGLTATAPGPATEGAGALRVVPNPAHGPAVLELTLAAAGPVTATLHDALGREVRRLAAGPYPAGALSLPVALDGLTPGVYTVRVTAGAGTWTQRLVVQ